MAVSFKHLLARARAGSARGRQDKSTGTIYTTPVRWRHREGVWIGFNGNAWLYRKLPLAPLLWEDPRTRLGVMGALADLLADLGATAQDIGSGMASLSRNREIHLVAITYERQPVPPPGTPPVLQEFITAALDFLVPHKGFYIGVKLRPSLLSAVADRRSGTSTLKAIQSQLTRALDEDTPDPELTEYRQDLRVVMQIMERQNRTRPLTTEDTAQLESWFNLGRGTDVELFETKDSIYVDDFDRLHFMAVTRFEQSRLEAPFDQWGLEAMVHPSAAHVVSIRGELQPASVTRKQLQGAQRRAIAQREEVAATGDVGGREQEEMLAKAESLEDYVLHAQEATLTKCSIVFAHRTRADEVENFADALEMSYGIHTTPLVHRQLKALAETLPCAIERAHPELQTVNLAMVAHAGLQGFSRLGDDTGVLLGLVDPDYVPCYLDPFGAPARNRAPGMLIAGDPGSGKTYAAQGIALQAALAGIQTIFVNPKGFDSLRPFAELARASGVPTEVVSMSRLEKEGGAFDPFRFCFDAHGNPDPEQAAEVATGHILTVLGNTGVAGQGFTVEQEVRLTAGLRRGALAGARCVGEALRYVDDRKVQELVTELARSESRFGLGIAFAPKEPFSQRHGLTLIEFDRPLPLPEKGVPRSSYTQSQRVSIAAMSLLTRASLNILANASGGVLVVDEAWTFLSSSEGLAALQALGRLGRSQNILPVFATQRVDDLLRSGVDMESYLSRVLIMKLEDPREARAAFELVRLEATEERVKWLLEAAPTPPGPDGPGQPALGLHRDLYGRHSALMIGPFPPAAHAAFTTNPVERERLQQAAGPDERT